MRMLPHTEANMPNTRCKRSNSYAILRKLLPPTQAKTTVGKHRKKKKLPQLATRSCLNEICVKIQAETHLPHEKTMRQLLEENEKHGAKTSRRSSVPNPRSPWGGPESRRRMCFQSIQSGMQRHVTTSSQRLVILIAGHTTRLQTAQMALPYTKRQRQFPLPLTAPG